MAKNFIPVLIDDLEETAKQEADFSCNKKIRGYWLEVTYHKSNGTFTYCWGKNMVDRMTAIRVLETA